MIRHKTARRIASEWHGGQHTPLYALSSSGAVLPGVLAEIAGCIPGAHQSNRPELASLLEYCKANMGRGPVPGWSGIRF